MGTAILRIGIPDSADSTYYAGPWRGTEYDKYLVVAQALRRMPGGSTIEAEAWCEEDMDTVKLMRLLTSEKGLEEIDGLTVAVLAKVLAPYNRFDPGIYVDVLTVFHNHFRGQERYFFGREGSEALYVATPWTMDQMLLDSDPKFNADKAFWMARFWRGFDRLEKGFDEIGYKEGKSYRYNTMLYPEGVPSSAIAVWGECYDPSDDQDVFEQDKLVFRLWVD